MRLFLRLTKSRPSVPRVEIAKKTSSEKAVLLSAATANTVVAGKEAVVSDVEAAAAVEAAVAVVSGVEAASRCSPKLSKFACHISGVLHCRWFHRIVDRPHLRVGGGCTILTHVSILITAIIGH